MLVWIHFKMHRSKPHSQLLSSILVQFWVIQLNLSRLHEMMKQFHGNPFLLKQDCRNMSVLPTTGTMQSCVVHVMRSVAVSSRKSSISARIRREDMASETWTAADTAGDSTSTTIAFQSQAAVEAWSFAKSRTVTSGPMLQHGHFQGDNFSRFEPSQPTRWQILELGVCE